jgi:hypothetical protein
MPGYPVIVYLTVGDGNLAPKQMGFNAKLCQVVTMAGYQSAPGALVTLSNNSSVEPLCQGSGGDPVWTAIFPESTSNDKPPSQSFN